MKTPRSVFFLAIICLAGCAGVSDSLRLNSTVLAKVPIDQPIETAKADGWEFRHILEAPHDVERRGEWYISWNDNKPFRFGGLMPSWSKLFSRAPEISLAEH